MIKVLSLFLTLLMFPTMSNSMAKVNLEDYLGSFSWDKRIVLLISKEENIHLIGKADDFFKRNSCENKARNLKYIRIVGNDITKYIIPDRYKNKFGIWLIGYDGEDKSYSNDSSLLREVHNIVDTMPVRKIEMIEQNKKCN